ncbi:hypothetical protein ABK040_005615 [Willaertia magna]
MSPFHIFFVNCYYESTSPNSNHNKKATMTLYLTVLCLLFLLLPTTSSATVLNNNNNSGQSLFALGTYVNGELGIDLKNTPFVPYPLSFFNFTTKDIFPGNFMTSFLTSSGELYSIGSNYGQFGDGNGLGTFTLTPSKFNITQPIVKVSIGFCHTLVLTLNGEVYGSGCNSNKQLWQSDISNNILSPILIFNSTFNIIDITTTQYGSFVLSRDGELYSMGEQSGHVNDDNFGKVNITTKRVIGSSSYVIIETFTKEFYIIGMLTHPVTMEKPTLIEIISNESNWLNCTDIKLPIDSIYCLTNDSLLYEINYIINEGFKKNLVQGTENYKIKLIGHDKFLTSDNYLVTKAPSTSVYNLNLTLNNLKPNTEIIKIITDVKHNDFRSYYQTNDGSFYFSIASENGNAGTIAGSTFGFKPLNITNRFNGNFNYSIINLTKPSKGNLYSVFLVNNNTIFTTGSNSYGQLGDGTFRSSFFPKNITFINEIVDISVGFTHTLILTKDGEVYGFGSNIRNQLCTNSYQYYLQKLPLTNVTAIAAGSDFSLFITANENGNSSVYTCGTATNGETGIGVKPLGTNANGYIQSFNNLNITNVVGGNGFSFFLSNNGTAYALGKNLKRRLGIEIPDTQIEIPTPIVTIPDKIVKISVAQEFSVFLTDKGEVYYTHPYNSKPLKVSSIELNGKVIIDIGTGYDYILILTNEGKLYGTIVGSQQVNYYGQLGIVNPKPSYTFERIPIYYKVKSIEVGKYHSFIVVSNEEPFCNCSHNNGLCIDEDKCECHSGWNGVNCTTFTCEAISNCSSRGLCVGPNECQCETGWKGNNSCSQYSCEKLLNCNNGVCIGPNQCKCHDGWEGDSCNVFNCNHTGFCNGNGTCIGPNICSCNAGYKGGPYCNVTSCENVGNCSNNNGLCTGPNTCSCFENWTGSNCSIPKCFNIPANETTTVCNNGNGTCIGPDQCQCNSNWGGLNCQIPKCFNILANETNKVCNNGNGICKGFNTCECFLGYFGSDCSQFSCKEVNYCSGHGICSGPNTCSCIIGWNGNLNCSKPSCELLNNCSKHGFCVEPNQCDCQPEWNVYKNCSERTINCESLNNCYGNGECIGVNQCKCFEGYQSFDCKYGSLSNDSVVISGNSEGTEKITTFSFSVNYKARFVIYNYFIENVFNQTTNSSTIKFTMKNKGTYNLIVTLFVKERQDLIFGKQIKTIIVNELKDYTITNFNINDIYEITKTNDIYNNENKSTIINQIVLKTQKEIIQTKDQSDKILEIYKSIIVKSNNDIPISVNITSQMNQISNLYLAMKQNDNITDTQINTSVQSIVLILDNILQQTNTSSNITNLSKDDLKRDTENTLQSTFSLLSLSKSIEEKRIEGNAINLVFKRRTNILNNNGNTNINFTNEYKFNIPTDLNLEMLNNDISFGAIKISDSQLYQTNNDITSLSNVVQLKTFVNGSYTPLKNLKQSIIISFKLESKEINSFNSNTSYSCRYFNENSKQWLSDGCKPAGGTTFNGIIVMNCECDHTTSFLTFLEFNSKSNNTSIAQLVLSSIYLIIIILIITLLIIFRKEPIVKSRYITPYIGLSAIFIDNLFSGIIATAIFQQTKIVNTISSITVTTSSASDIVGNVAIIISSMMTLIAIACYFIEAFRYLIVRYLYELLNNNLNSDSNQVLDSDVEKKPLLRVLSSKVIYIISNLVIGISIIIYYVIFVILRRFNVISAHAFTSVTTITFFVLIILFSLAILSIYIIDIYFTMKYKQFSYEMVDIIKMLEVEEQNSSTSSISTTAVTNNTKSTKNNKKEMLNNYQNNLINFFYNNDSLQFRSEACIYFIGLMFFLISFGIGFYLLSKEQLKEQQQLSEVILAFDLIRTICWIMLFGGYITTIILFKKLNKKFKKSNDTNKISEENEEFNFSYILKKREVFKLFKQFAKQEFSLENIYAFFDLENLKELNNNSTVDSTFWEEVEKFKLKYLITNATMELNVSFEIKKQVNNYLKERKDFKLLIECLENALSINLGDTYSRFIETDEYQIIDKCNEMKEKLMHN